MKDDLKALLEKWQPSIPEPVDFRRKVWHRIRALPGWTEIISMFIARHRVAACVIAFALSLGRVARKSNSSLPSEQRVFAFGKSLQPATMKRGIKTLSAVLAVGLAAGIVTYYLFWQEVPPVGWLTKEFSLDDH